MKISIKKTNQKFTIKINYFLKINHNRLVTFGNIFKYYSNRWFGEETSEKLSDPFFCPKCTLEGIRSELKNYPNHILVCKNCQFVCRQVGDLVYHIFL